MCGIIGVVSSYPVKNREWLQKGCNLLSHRGPDSNGIFWSDDKKVGLGHRRLSIIDISDSGAQPMHDSSGSYTIVFNGEIYNFTELKKELTDSGCSFQSDSDTEVILAAYHIWGEKLLERLNGMFVFALYDRRKNTILFARDRAGEKPLFYYFKNNTLSFASELKGLLANKQLPAKIDPAAMELYLTMGFIPGDYCILNGFKKLPPAHAMRFCPDSGKLETWAYWQLPESSYQHNDNETILAEELEKLLEDSVRRQLMSDVPIGILLSGGVDSSLITALAARSVPRVKTFTISFPGYGKFNESEHARLIADHFQTEHTELEAGQIKPDLLPELSRQYDEPVTDSSMIPTFLVSKLIRTQCTVALGGDGGDELFGGYAHYATMLKLQQRFASIPFHFRKLLASAAEWLLPTGFKGREFIQAIGCDFRYDLPRGNPFFDKPSRLRLLKNAQNYVFCGEQLVKKRQPTEKDILRRACLMDFYNYLPDDILVKVDRASMLSSLEVRAPFLDYRIIEFAFCRVPSNLKATVNDKKILLKTLACRILPPEFDRQRKQGFSIPLQQWLQKGEFRQFFSEILLDEDSLFSKKYIHSLLQGLDKGRRNSERLFSLALFELWRKAYSISPDFAPDKN